MKKNVMLFLALASVGFASCNGGYKQADGGLLYEIHVDKGGTPIQTGDFVTLNVVGKTDADSVLFSTYDNGRPAELLVQKPHKGDIFTGLEKLAEGDSATIKICADSIFKKGQPKPPGFKGKYVSYDIKIIKVIAKGKLSEAVFEGSINNYLKNEALGLKKLEPGKMKFYIAHEKLNVTQTPDSLEYQITQQGSGPKPIAGDTVVVNYTGRMLSGKIFDSSIKDSIVKAKLPQGPRKYTPIHIPIGQKRVIAGWDEGLMLLNKGSKAILVIPSNLAYGPRGAQGMIPPYTPIAFEVELVDIIHPNPNAPKPPVPTFGPAVKQVVPASAPAKK